MGNDFDGLFLLENSFACHVCLQISQRTVLSDYVTLVWGFIYVITFENVWMVHAPEDINFPLKHL